MNTFADQVVEFTVTLVRALQRVGQFEPGKPSFARTRARLWKELVRLQRAHPEIGYVIGPPAVAGGLPELWVDGTAPTRVELRRIVGSSLGGAFVLQLSEYMRRRGLVILALSRGITEVEWNTFLTAMSEPSVHQSAPAEGQRLSQALVAQQVVHASLVSDGDVPQTQGDLPWPIRLAYARLLRELRAAALAGEIQPARLFEQSERLIAGMAYSYFRKFDVLRQMLFRADIIDRCVLQIPALRSVEALKLIVHGLPALSLQGTTNLIFRELGPDTPVSAEPNRGVLRAIAERMLELAPSRQIEETLRAMCRRRVIPITRLPVELQEWVLAEIWVEALCANPAEEPPIGSADIDPIRVLQKSARFAFANRKSFAQAVGILQRIWRNHRAAVPAVFDAATVQAMLTEFPESNEERRGMVALLELGGQTAANSTATVLTTSEGKVSEAAAWVLAQMKALGVTAALGALDQDIEKEETVRLLLSCVSGKSPATGAPAFVRQIAHRSPRIRRDALTALVAACPGEASSWVARALADPDENVRIRALLLCASSGVGGEQVIPRAIKIVSRDARGASSQVVRAAIEVVIRRWEAGALAVAQAEDALCSLARPIGIIGRMLGQTSPPSAVLLIAVAALGRLGTERAARLLVKLERSKDVAVARAAQRALDGETDPVEALPASEQA